MNAKRAKMIRKLSVSPAFNAATKVLLSKMYKFVGVDVTDRHVYKHMKKIDNDMTTAQKEVFNVNKIKATLP